LRGNPAPLGLNARGHRVRPGFSWQWWMKREDHTSGVVNVGTARYRLRTRDVLTRFLNGSDRSGTEEGRKVTALPHRDAR
jgi:hypothetical protein